MGTIRCDVAERTCRWSCARMPGAACSLRPGRVAGIVGAAPTALRPRLRCQPSARRARGDRGPRSTRPHFRRRCLPPAGHRRRRVGLEPRSRRRPRFAAGMAAAARGGHRRACRSSARSPDRAAAAARAPARPCGRSTRCAATVSVVVSRDTPCDGAPCRSRCTAGHRSECAVGGAAVRAAAVALRRACDQGREHGPSRRCAHRACAVLRSAECRQGKCRARFPRPGGSQALARPACQGRYRHRIGPSAGAGADGDPCGATARRAPRHGVARYHRIRSSGAHARLDCIRR